MDIDKLKMEKHKRSDEELGKLLQNATKLLTHWADDSVSLSQHASKLNSIIKAHLVQRPVQIS